MVSTLPRFKTGPSLGAHECELPPCAAGGVEDTPQVAGRGSPSASHKDARYWERISALVSGCDPLTAEQVDRLRKIMRRAA